jgi:putative ABC transport system permease protein
MKWLIFALRNVLRNRRRSLVTMLIAAVGTAGILIGGGFALFTYDALRDAAARDSGHVIIANKHYFDRDEDTPMQFGLAAYSALRDRIELDPRVRRVLPRLQFSGLISNGDKSAVFIGTGVDPGGEFAARGPFLQVIAGSTLSDRPDPALPPEVILGDDLARQMNARPGSSLTLLATTTAGSLNAIDVRVQGVVSMGAPEIDKRLVMVNVGTAQQLLLTDRISTLAVYLRDTDDTSAMRAELARSLPDAALQTWADQAFYYVAVRGLYNRIFGLLGLVIVVMVLFAVSNTLAMAVVERTREIGTLRALGTLPRQIMRIFALEGLVLGTAGVLFGMLGAAAVSVFFMFAGVQMPPPPGRSVGYPLLVNISPPLYAATAITIVCLAALAAWLVSRRAARRPIVEALGHV